MNRRLVEERRRRQEYTGLERRLHDRRHPLVTILDGTETICLTCDRPRPPDYYTMDTGPCPLTPDNDAVVLGIVTIALGVAVILMLQVLWEVLI